MKKDQIKKAATLLLILVLTMFSACGSTESDNAELDAAIDSAVNAALEAALVPTNVTIEADGRSVTIEDAGNVSLQELLFQAGITISEGDILSVAPHQALSGNITVQVIRSSTITVDQTQPEDVTPQETQPEETEPEETQPTETLAFNAVVNIEYYEDCDGSGHGIKVITYADGTQEEVMF